MARSATLPPYGPMQTKCSARIAAMTAAARALSRSIFLIPADAERAEGDEHQARRSELQGKLRQAEDEQERGQRPPHRACEGDFQPARRVAWPPPAGAERDRAEKERVSGQSRFGRYLEVIVVRRAPVARVSARPFL